MKLWKFVIIGALIVFGGLETTATTRYATIHNRFGSIMQIAETTISGEYLICDNNTSDDILLTDTTLIYSEHYRLQMRMANEHNAPRRSYSVIDS